MYQLLPCRDRVALNAPLFVQPLPESMSWTGAIAYLDRDGVLNKGSPNYINSPSEVEILPDAGKCIAKLRMSGMRIAVVTNQSPVGRGLWDSENLAKIHDTLQEMLLLDDPEAIIDLILHSPYPPFYDAWARKPRPGMLEAARQLLDHAESGEEWSKINMRFGSEWMNRPSEESSVMVGDRMSDMEAARSFNVNGILCPPDVGLSGVIDQII